MNRRLIVPSVPQRTQGHIGDRGGCRVGLVVRLIRGVPGRGCLMDWRAIRSTPQWSETQGRLHIAPVILSIMVDLNFSKRAESVRGSVVHVRVSSVGKARVERWKYRASVLA